MHNVEVKLSPACLITGSFSNITRTKVTGATRLLLLARWGRSRGAGVAVAGSITNNTIEQIPIIECLVVTVIAPGTHKPFVSVYYKDSYRGLTIH